MPTSNTGKLRRAIRAATRAERDSGEAEGAFFGSDFGGRWRAHTAVGSYHEEECEGNYQEGDYRVDEVAVVDCGPVEVYGQRLEVHPAYQFAHRWHDDVVYERLDDSAESRPQDESDSQIEYVAFVDERLELVDHLVLLAPFI